MIIYFRSFHIPIDTVYICITGSRPFYIGLFFKESQNLYLLYGDIPAFTGGGISQVPLHELFHAQTNTRVEPPFRKLAA